MTDTRPRRPERTQSGRAAARPGPEPYQREAGDREHAHYAAERRGGIESYVSAEQPPGVPEEEWLPIERKDEDLNVIMRLYVPDLEAYEDWTPPVFERVDAG